MRLDTNDWTRMAAIMRHEGTRHRSRRLTTDIQAVEAGGKKQQETLTLAVGLRPRTRVAKVLALRMVAVRLMLLG